jgi:hypothetical protein
VGHQQVLIAILGILIVGIAIAVGVTMFQGNAADSSRSALINDLQYLASRARSQYWKPRSLGGANRSFENIQYTSISTLRSNENGRYYIESAEQDELVFVGVGRVVSGEDTVRVRMRVNERKSKIEIIN